MKILHLLYESDGDYFGIGGVGARAYEIYSRLKFRHDVTLLCKKYPGASEGYRDGLRHLFAGTESRSLARTLFSYAYHAARFVREKGSGYDVIVEEFSPATPMFLHAVANKPVVLQVQGYTGSLYFRKYNPFFAAALVLMEQLRPVFYRNFIFINDQTAAKFSRNPASRTAVIANGIPPELLVTNAFKGDYVLYFGRIDIFGKGLDLLLEAYTEFSHWFPGMRLLVAGDGRDMEAFKTAVMALPGEVRKKIELLGWVSGAVKTDVLSKAAFAVFPSRHEVQPIAVLEAMACGKPVVVSDIPAFHFVQQNGAGIFFRSGDASSLARSLKELAECDTPYETGLRGRDLAKKMTWDKVAGQFEEFLVETAGLV